MQNSLRGTQRHCCSPQTPEQKLYLTRKGLPPLKRRRGRKSQVTKAFVGAAAEPLVSAGLGWTLSSGLVSIFSFALGGIGLAFLLSDQARQERGPNPECGSCDGTGLVPCICNRWSDGDSGCSVCKNTGRMTCPSCRGGGTAVPIAATITASSQRDLMADQRR